MALQLILGSSGSGKSHFIYKKIIEESMENPFRQYVVLVPEQFTMQTQRRLVQMHPGGGILNVDVLSFERLAYRVFQEVGGNNLPILEETGKSLVIQKVVQKKKEKLGYLENQLKKTGCIQEMKSLISEFMQYDVKPGQLEKLAEDFGEQSLLGCKLRDIQEVYQGFEEYLQERFLTAEEVLDVLCRRIFRSEKLKGCVFVLDGYTGFTPVQLRLIRELLILAEKMYVTVTMDPASVKKASGRYQLFSMSAVMRQKLFKAAEEAQVPVEPEVWVDAGEQARFGGNPELRFLERHLFRYYRSSYETKPKAVFLRACKNPLTEVEDTARKIKRLIREKGYRYGEIAVVTGDLPTYASYVRWIFQRSDIPYFIDEKHTILMNPFVEFLRAAMEVMTERFSYESCFRYLRCSMSSLTLSQIDEMDNYVTALGIQGYVHWKEKWVRLYRGLDEKKIMDLNQSREIFLEELAPMIEGFRGRGKTVRERSEALYTFAVKNEVQRKLKIQEMKFASQGQKAMEREYAQIYGIVINLLDKMVEILGEEKVSAREYQQLFEAGLAEARIGVIPPSTDQILVGDMERTRLSEIRALFFLGMNEGSIPKNPNRGGLLSEADREAFQKEEIELAPDSRELLGQARFYLYLNLTKPQDFLFLSYSQANARGESLAPSYLVSMIQKLFPHLKALPEEQMEALDQLESPRESLAYFLKGLQQLEYGQEDLVWEELYRWYRQSDEYHQTAEKLVEAAFYENPMDRLSARTAEALYQEVSPYGATRLEQYSACAFAHFLRYGLQVTERQEYEFRALDLGNVMHQTLELFSRKLRSEHLSWRELKKEDRERLMEESLDQVAADYGNTILHSSARNEYRIQRTKRILNRTAWALQEQLKRGDFLPEGFEVAFEGGRIDRVDICEDGSKVYVKVMDYKTGNMSFDLMAVYHGLQLQLMVYLDAALQVEQRKYRDKDVMPAAVFYYNIKDPLIREKVGTDLGQVEKKLLKELKVNGLVERDTEVLNHLDPTLETLPVTRNKDGSFRKGSSVADRKQFHLLSEYVSRKIQSIREEILSGNVSVSPYQMDKKEACTYCPYKGICGFDSRFPGFAYRRLQKMNEAEVWKKMDEEVKKWK